MGLLIANHLDGASGEFSFHCEARRGAGARANSVPHSSVSSEHQRSVRQSTVDYALIDARPELVRSLSFAIEDDWFTLSDHRPITLSLSLRALFSPDRRAAAAPRNAIDSASPALPAAPPAASGTARKALRTRWKQEYKIDVLQSAFSPLASEWLLERERILSDRAANILSSRDAIDRLASTLSSAITTAMHNAVGTVPARNDHSAKPNSPFYFRSSRYDRLVGRCQAAGRRWQRAKSTADSAITATLEREYRSLCQERKAMAAQLLKASRARYFKRVEEEAKGDARRFWHEHGRLFRSNSAVSYEARRLPQAVLGPGGRRKLITAPEEVLERWRETFEAVCASEPPTAQHATDFMREVSESLRLPFERLPESARSEALISLERAVSPDEVKSAIKRMRRNAASGADSIPSSFFKDGGARVVECVTHLLNDVLSCGEWPSDWMLGWIIPIYKKGVRADTGNYRGITLLPALDKLCRSVLNHRLSAAIESSHLLSDYQVGFRAHRGTMDHLITLNELITAHREQKQPLYMGFLDVAKAYDHTWRDGLWWRLRRIGVTDKLLRVWRSSYKHVTPCSTGRRRTHR